MPSVITLTDKKKFLFAAGYRRTFLKGNLDTLDPKMTIILFNQLLFLRYCKKNVLLKFNKNCLCNSALNFDFDG